MMISVAAGSKSLVEEWIVIALLPAQRGSRWTGIPTLRMRDQRQRSPFCETPAIRTGSL